MIQKTISIELEEFLIGALSKKLAYHVKLYQNLKHKTNKLSLRQMQKHIELLIRYEFLKGENDE